MERMIPEYLDNSINPNNKYLHITLGACQYYPFKKGQIVEISDEGYQQGIHEFNVDCFGIVEDFSLGILHVKVFEREKTLAYHPCYWIPATKASHEAWKCERKQLDMENTC